MKTYLGIELGSTRIKAVTINEAYRPVSSGDYTWASKLEDGIWTYDLPEALTGLRNALDGMTLGEVDAVGISAMMHGYLAFDKDWNLLVPFRTWQNTVTAQAAEKLTALFGFNVPQRWSIAHLYQAVLNNEEHVGRIAHITTLAGYVHYRLTGENVLGVGDASGMFPIDSRVARYDTEMLSKFDALTEALGLPWHVIDLLPKVLVAGENGGYLTAEGASLLGNVLPVGTPFAPPEGDAGTGMTATNAVTAGTGNVSAGTSIFSMVVLSEPLKNVYEEIDVVTTPDGKPVAMVHCNNCTNDSNAWVSMLEETAMLFGATPDKKELYAKLYEKSLEGDADCGGVLVCNYMAGEGVTHMDEGRPMVVRYPDAKFTLANFFKATLYATMATLRLGMEILTKENVRIDSLTGHGGLFKTPVVGQRYMAAATGAPVTVTETAGEGGAFGIALLAAFLAQGKGESLDEFLAGRVFANAVSSTLMPDEADVAGFDAYMTQYKKLIAVEKAAVEIMK